MKILLTGATGFVGLHLAPELVARGHEVFALVRQSSKHEPLTRQGVKIVFGDLSGGALNPADIPDIDAVIHVAGLIKAKRVEDYYRVNAEGTRQLLLAVKDKAVKKFILVSSIAARGPNASDSDTLGIGPVSHYGKSKLAGEDIVLTSLPHEKVVIIRPPVVYGPGDQPTLTLFKMFRRGIFPLLGKGESKVSFIYVADLCRLIALAVENPIRHYGPFYPDDGSTGHTWDEIARLGGELYGRRVRTPRLPLALVRAAAHGSELAGMLFDFVPMLSQDKFAELKHAYWFCSGQGIKKVYQLPEPLGLAHGLMAARAWYESEGWL